MKATSNLSLHPHPQNTLWQIPRSGSCLHTHCTPHFKSRCKQWTVPQSRSDMRCVHTYIHTHHHVLLWRFDPETDHQSKVLWSSEARDWLLNLMSFPTLACILLSWTLSNCRTSVCVTSFVYTALQIVDCEWVVEIQVGFFVAVVAAKLSFEWQFH